MTCGPIADCLTLIDGLWKTTTTLLEERYTLGNPVTGRISYRVTYTIIISISKSDFQVWTLQLGLTIRTNATRRQG